MVLFAPFCFCQYQELGFDPLCTHTLSVHCLAQKNEAGVFSATTVCLLFAGLCSSSPDLTYVGRWQLYNIHSLPHWIKIYFVIPALYFVSFDFPLCAQQSAAIHWCFSASAQFSVGTLHSSRYNNYNSYEV